MVAPIMPSPSTIQNKIKDPTSGVTRKGKSETNMDGPFIILGRPLTPIAIANPSIKTNGVTTAVYVSVNAKAP